MTPEKWQSIAVGLGVALMLGTLIPMFLRHVARTRRAHVSLLSIFGALYIYMTFYLAPNYYVDHPWLFGMRYGFFGVAVYYLNILWLHRSRPPQEPDA
jgi:hypothetical protein